jgi:hypothetical protein
MNRLAELLAREEIMEKHQSRIEWLKVGDRNMGVFQAKDKQRSCANKILHLKRDDGSLCTAPEEIKEMTTSFYKGLFTTQDHMDPNGATRFVPRKVTTAMNGMLETPFSEHEVKKALFMMHPNKAPGPNGLQQASFKSTGILLRKM